MWRGTWGDWQLTPTTLKSTVDNVSTSFWPSKSYRHGRSANCYFRTRVGRLRARGEAYNLPLGHIADLVKNLLRHGEAGRSRQGITGGAYWVSIKTECFSNDARLDKRLGY